MKVLGINGSPRKDGNTSLLIKAVFDELEKRGIEKEIIQNTRSNISGFIACMMCFKNKIGDAPSTMISSTIVLKMAASDGILLDPQHIIRMLQQR